MKLLFVGDIVGRSGRRALARHLPQLRSELSIDIVIANAENAAGGLGVTPTILDELLGMGIGVLTLGNHTWRKKELASALDRYERVVRPANYPAGLPGKGSTVVSLGDGRSVGVTNVIGRTFMEPFACPFERAREEVRLLRGSASVVIVDVHAEATSEKTALGWYLDGQCAAVVGTHTHVQTADERVLPKGTAYITDVGMTGPERSVIGVEPDSAIRKFLTGMPAEYRLAKGPACLCAVVVDADDSTGLAHSIQRLFIRDGIDSDDA